MKVIKPIKMKIDLAKEIKYKGFYNTLKAMNNISQHTLYDAINKYSYGNLTVEQFLKLLEVLNLKEQDVVDFKNTKNYSK